MCAPMPRSLQETYAPSSICFGCGPANAQGLHVRSIAPTDEALRATEAAGQTAWVTAEWKPAPHHEAFPGMVNGGIIGALLDCHSNWTAAWQLMRRAGLDHPPCTVTADFHVKLRRPTPSAETLRLRARAVETTDDRAVIEAELWAVTPEGEKICATCRGTFVAVKPGHPAYHRW
jgi:acyl-coenzyme A thioesterase PaaI-like protein